MITTVALMTRIEDQQTADDRIPHLLRSPAAVRGLSMEPLLSAVDLSAWFTRPRWGKVNDRGRRPHEVVPNTESGISWVIVGGESGPNARPMHPDWARSIRDQCQEAGVPFFFKQWGEWIGGKFDRQKFKMICQTSATSERTGRIFWTNPGAPKVHLWDEADHYWTHASARVGKQAAGRLLDGREWNEMPEVTQ